MRGAFSKFLYAWPMQIDHNNKNDPEKEKRYAIGAMRIRLLRINAEVFGYQQTEQGEIVAFLNHLGPYDRAFGMPEHVKVEYIAGIVSFDGTCSIFSYIWFSSKEEAAAYAKRHKMTLV